MEHMARSVEEMAERLAREEHARARFISKVSHELRTPLTVVKGYVSRCSAVSRIRTGWRNSR